LDSSSQKWIINILHKKININFSSKLEKKILEILNKYMKKRLYLEPLSLNGVIGFLKVGIKLSLQETSMKQAPASYLLHDGYLLGLLFNPEDARPMFLHNVS
jgi:hypothetical protein